MGMGRLSDLDWFAWEGLGRIELVEWLGLDWIGLWIFCMDWGMVWRLVGGLELGGLGFDGFKREGG